MRALSARARGSLSLGLERVEAGKERGVSEICGEPRRRPDAEWKADIRRQARESRLLCKNCHHERTHEGLQIRERDDFATGLTDLEEEDDDDDDE